MAGLDGEDGVGDEAAEEGGGFAGIELEEFGAGAGMGAEGGEGFVAAGRPEDEMAAVAFAG